MCNHDQHEGGQDGESKLTYRSIIPGQQTRCKERAARFLEGPVNTKKIIQVQQHCNQGNQRVLVPLVVACR